MATAAVGNLIPGDEGAPFPSAGWTRLVASSEMAGLCPISSAARLAAGSSPTR